MDKSLLKSKRFWSGLITTITAISIIFTGERTIAEQLPIVLTAIFAFVQTIIALRSTDVIAGFGRNLPQNSLLGTVFPSADSNSSASQLGNRASTPVWPVT